MISDLSPLYSRPSSLTPSPSSLSMPPRRNRPGSSTSASDSQSPPSDAPPSPRFSPTSTHPLSDDGESPKTMKNTRPHLGSYSAGKGGCWTCRLRRKKCDEQRDGNSCKTCIRLNIECLGWGIKRPDWMRDKQRVQVYRAKITDKLRRENRIRGQPRQVYSQPQQNQSLPNTPTTTAPTAQNNRSKSFVATPNTSNLEWSTPESTMTAHHQHPGYSLSNPASGSNSPHIPGIPMLSVYPDQPYPDQNTDYLDMTSPFNFSNPSQSPVSMPQDPLFNISYSSYSHEVSLALQYPTQPALQAPDVADRQPTQLSSQTEELVVYFFRNVKARQFKFYGDANDITNVILSIIIREPQGAVANAICALSSLHLTKFRQSSGHEPLDPNPEHSFGKFLYDQALIQLIDAKQRYGSFSEADAIAALNLTSFGLFSDGWTEWAGPMRIAEEWLAGTGLLTDENPGLFIANMGPSATYAVKTTIWLDIFASITNMQPPRFMDLYHRLFSDDGGYAAPLRMDQVTGFSDDVLYAMAQVSALAHWKSIESANGRLSMRELIRRGDAIEQRLRRPEKEHSGPRLDIGIGGEPPLASPSTHAGYPNAEVRRIVRTLFRESTILYLHTILSDPIPGVQEIISGVDTVIHLMQQLPPSDLDHGLVFPICLAGCMADNASQRQYLVSRLQDAGNIGNLLQTRSAMEGVWQRRDLLRAAGAPNNQFVDWRECLRDQGTNLLLI